MKRIDPIHIAHLLPELDRLLLECLRNLSPGDWERRTVAPQWSVKDVAAHLLDSNFRSLSMLRDGYRSGNPGSSDSYDDLVVFLNKLNADWVRAFRRVSPAVLTDLLEISGRQFCEYMQSLDPAAPAVWSVAWAGESQSQNWFHVAREYTEKWHHQQQIRFSIGDEHVLLTERLYLPYLDTSMRGLPHHYRGVNAVEGTTICFSVSGLIGARWYLVRANNRWELFSACDTNISCSVEIDKSVAWRIVTKGISTSEAQSHVHIEGEHKLGNHILGMIAVMA
ncbi:MAG: maleylpyruvate isomerase N-terminal domain-containing protein [Ignavibacteriales bacterium]|nr:maleylpyruvate isomerase N-terminal domain-containing protein [Ignavibacteriales bacterium]